MNEAFQLIANKLPEMSKSQRKIGKYVLNNQEAVPFFTIEKLARMSEVSEATVVRFASFLGFKGYPQLQQSLQETVKRKLTTVERLELSNKIYDKEGGSITEIFDQEIAHIRYTRENLDLIAFNEAVDEIIKAKRIFIIANRSAVSLGLFLEFYLDLLFQNTELIRNPHGISEKLFRINHEDVVIGLSFARYTKNTIEAVSFAKDYGAKIIAITDNLFSPMIPHAHISLFAPSEIPSYLDSFVAPLSLVNALLIAIGKTQRSEIEKHLNDLEEVWQRFEIFQSSLNE